MLIIVGGGFIAAVVLLLVMLVAGGVYSVVDFFVQNQVYFIGASLFLTLIRSIVVSKKTYEVWQGVLYFILEIPRMALSYITLIWYASDWIKEAQSGLDGILGIIVRAGIEGAFMLFFVIIGITMPWLIFSKDENMIDLTEDFPWSLPLISMLPIAVPLLLRVIVEAINNAGV